MAMKAKAEIWVVTQLTKTPAGIEVRVVGAYEKEEDAKIRKDCAYPDEDEFQVHFTNLEMTI